MNRVWQMRRDSFNNSALHGPNVSHSRAVHQARTHFLGHGLHRADGNRQHHKIGSFNRLGSRVYNPVAKPNLARDVACLSGPRSPHDFACQAVAAHRMRHGRGDQSKPD